MRFLVVRPVESTGFKIPVFRADDSEQTSSSKKKAKKEWLRLILRTREITPELKQRIEENNVYVCELHFKSDCILTSKYLIVIIVTGEQRALYE